MLAVIYNPCAGDGSAKRVLDQHVLPLVGKVDIVRETQHPGHAAQLFAELVQEAAASDSLTILLLSGDGTLHEMLNPIPQTTIPISIALVPCGTANALFASLFPPSPSDQVDEYRLRAIKALVSQPSNTLPFTLAVTEWNGGPRKIYAAVVTSTSLHASILHDSEALRAQIPGMDRFKVAAQQNLSRWYRARVRLDGARRYDPATKSFESQPETVHLDGPFAYFLSVVNVDRLEPAFRIAPLMTNLPEPDVMDVILCRPARDPSLDLTSPEAGSQFGAKTMQISMAAYQEGAHVQLRYDSSGALTSEAQGPPAVEYFRCTGWEWSPDADDDAAHLVCTDGLITEVPKGAKVHCTVETRSPTHIRLHVDRS